MEPHNRLIAVTKLSKKGTSLRMTLPKEISAILLVEEMEHIGFYEENGKIWIKKIE
jgi:antitoxin component of MazEF toxin-antitoxin module